MISYQRRVMISQNHLDQNHLDQKHLDIAI